MTAPRRKPKRKPYRPFIDVSVAVSAEDPQGYGVILACLHFDARDLVILQEYQVQGPACEHVFQQANPADLKALDKLVARAKAIGDALDIPVRIEKDALADLCWASEQQDR